MARRFSFDIEAMPLVDVGIYITVQLSLSHSLAGVIGQGASKRRRTIFGLRR
jgi:hypothetical protein